MASALDILPLDEVKDYIGIDRDYTYDDALLTRQVKAAVALVEAYTQHRLYERTETRLLRDNAELYDYPLKVERVGPELEPYAFTLIPRMLHNVLSFGSTEPKEVTLTVGYATGKTPEALLEAVLATVAYFYEHRGAYKAELPTDVQLFINPFRRSATI